MKLATRFGGEALGSPAARIAEAIPKGSVGEELAELLQCKNGFYAFESALHVLPFAAANPSRMDLLTWNAADGWKGEYGSKAADMFCFAEDLFGEQFAIFENAVWRFDPETGDREPLSATLEQWAAQVIEDPDFVVGHTLGHNWQQANGALPLGKRLLPAQPFVFEGEYSVENLAAIPAFEGMSFRADLARQIADLPGGAEIVFRPKGD